MTPIRYFAIAAIAIATLFPNQSIQADEPSTRAGATVKIFFVNQWLPAPQRPQKKTATSDGVSAGRAMGGGMGGGTMQSLRFETVRIFLDDHFIGHAMFRHIDVMPTLNLDPGEHTFTFECDGYERHEEKLTVLSNGSTQWLVVTLKPPTKNSRSKTNASPQID